MSELGQKLKGSRRANVFCSSLNNGHQDHNQLSTTEVGLFVFLIPEFLRVNEAHRSGAFKPRRFDHPSPQAAPTGPAVDGAHLWRLVLLPRSLLDLDFAGGCFGAVK